MTSESELARWLAREAQMFDLNPENVDWADTETLRSYCALVLTELAARGLIEGGPAEIGCYAGVREVGH